MPTAVLLAETQPGVRSYLERHLRRDGFDVLPAEPGADAFELVERVRPDLVLLGAELGEPWERDVPLIVLGQTQADAVDRVRALTRGADDYLGRPFAYDELLARIHAVLRRTAPPRREVIEAGEISVDLVTRCVTVAGHRILLPAKEFELLAKLASEPLRVFTKDELLREVWGFRSLGRTRTLDSHASRLRRKIAEATETPYVLNEWGVGYRLMLPPLEENGRAHSPSQERAPFSTSS